MTFVLHEKHEAVNRHKILYETFSYYKSFKITRGYLIIGWRAICNTPQLFSFSLTPLSFLFNAGQTEIKGPTSLFNGNIVV